MTGYRLNYKVQVLSPEPIPEDMTFTEMVREGIIGSYALDVRQEGTMEILTSKQTERALKRAGLPRNLFNLPEYRQ